MATCVTATADAKRKRTTQPRQSNTQVNIHSNTDYSGLFHYREYINGGRRIHDYFINMDPYDDATTPACELVYYDVYNGETTYYQCYPQDSKNTIVFQDYNDHKITVTILSKNKIKVTEYGFSLTFKRIANSLGCWDIERIKSTAVDYLND